MPEQDPPDPPVPPDAGVSSHTMSAGDPLIDGEKGGDDDDDGTDSGVPITGTVGQKGQPYNGPANGVGVRINSSGNLSQVRLWNEDGDPDVDIDYDHDHGQGVPHFHWWPR